MSYAVSSQHMVFQNSSFLTMDLSLSQEFATFMKKNGVKHIRVAPYHPASNGAVERLVQTFKQAMRAVTGNGLSSQHNLNNFLMYTQCPQKAQEKHSCKEQKGTP